MTRITIDVDTRAARDLFTKLADFGAEPVQLALKSIGEALYNSTRERAAREIGPDGVPWAALSPRYAKRKQRLRPGAPLLKFDNHMLGDEFSYQLGDGYVDIGTDAPYGTRQQFGGGGIPARPFLGASEDDIAEIQQILSERLQAALDED